MIFTTRNLLLSILILIFGYIGWRTYVRFFYTTPPVIEIAGIAPENYYCNTVPCSTKVFSRAKLQGIAMTLDGVSVLPQSVSGCSITKSFVVVCKRLSNGRHVLTVEAIDATRNHNKATATVPFYVDNLPLQAAFARPESEFNVPQGRVFHVVLATNKPLKRVAVKLFSREFIAVPESEYARSYECFIPLECEEKPGEYPLSVVIDDFVGNHAELAAQMHVVAGTFKRQVLHHIDPARFEEERKLGRNNKELGDALATIAAHSPQKKLWQGTFYIPINYTWVACEFGTKRVSQERGCYTHAAVDLVGPVQHGIVWAPQDGVIALKDRFEINGNTIVIDHGCGVITLLCHLDQFADLAVGDKIRRGSPVGHTGKTGYATGDHLHWEMRVNNTQVDPWQWTKADF